MKMAPLVLAAMLLQGAPYAAAKEVAAWFVPSEMKVMRDAKPDGAALRWELAAATNEVEACQLVLSANETVECVTVSATPLSKSGVTNTLQPELFKVEYVPVKREKIPYPDPLPPLTEPISLQPGQAQPIWISVRVPKDAEPGVYSGTVSVKTGGATSVYSLSLKVWDFALPETPSCTTAFGTSYDLAAEWHGLAPNSPEAKALAKKYYGFLLEHRLSSIQLPIDLMSDEAAKYLSDPRMTSYYVPIGGKSDAELKAIVERLLAGGWFAKGYFYEVDEPVNKATYDAFAAVTDRLKKIEPRYRIVAPFYANPDFDSKLRTADLMLGRLNVWCPHSDYLDANPSFEQFLHARKNAGETIWWYVCNNPREPHSNLQIDQNGMAHRTLLWQQKRWGIDGLLYWCTNYWPKTLGDPWENMDTIGTAYYGDGSLLYPGKKVGIDGPVSSIRLEVLRDSLDDYDYLGIADRRLGAEATKGFVARIARSSTDYERSPAAFELVRRELGEAIEKAARKAE
jgi:hypothetical protein